MPYPRVRVPDLGYHALGRAGIVEGYEHRCRWCGFSLRAPDAEPRYCATCKKATDGRGNQVENPRGRRLWPRAIQIKMRFHDLRHTFGTTAVQAFPLSDVKAYMGHADISTRMLYVHHVPQVGAAEKLSALVAEGTGPTAEVDVGTARA